MADHTLSQNVAATIIPAGTPVELTAGTQVHIVQTLGGNVTVRTEQGLCRIAQEDAVAIAGYVAQSQEAGESDVVAEFSEEAVWNALRTCFDPEIPVNIVDLGLIYHLELTPGERGGQKVAAKMTLTAQGCGMGPVIAADAKSKMEALPGVESAEVEIVWDPVWNPRMISEAGRKQLGLE